MNLSSIENGFEPTSDHRCAVSRGGMVATSFPGATAAGVEMLEQGGNAVDAATAVGFALGVCDPQMSGLGGQSLGLVHMEGKTYALDGSGRVPSLAHVSKLEEGQRGVGYRACTVPSTPAALGWMHECHGKLPFAEVLAPAIRLAREGHSITERTRLLQIRERDNFLSIPSRSGARAFLKGGSEPFDVGDCFKQPELASLLERLAAKGVSDFYIGEIAAQIDADMRANDGFLRADDLALIPWPIVRTPLRRRYREVTIATMPPPGSGRTLLLVLMMLNHLDSERLAAGGKEIRHFVAETFRKAFMQRLERPFDPNTYPQVRNKRMLQPDFARELAESIIATVDPTLPIDPTIPPMEETTHFSVMDAEGGAVAITQSVELAYGSKAAADGLGFLYNSYMLALDVENPRHPYYLRPNAVPWSSAAPSFVYRDGRIWIALGSPGSETIYSSIAQVLMGVVDGSVPLGEAVKNPRLHCSVGGTISLEAERFRPETVDYLERQGYGLDRRPPFSIGCVQATLRRSDGEGFQGVADPRRDGTAAGPA